MTRKEVFEKLDKEAIRAYEDNHTICWKADGGYINLCFDKDRKEWFVQMYATSDRVNIVTLPDTLRFNYFNVGKTCLNINGMHFEV